LLLALFVIPILAVNFFRKQTIESFFEFDVLNVVKEWLKNNSKFSLWEWLYNSISPNKHQRIYR